MTGLVTLTAIGAVLFVTSTVMDRRARRMAADDARVRRAVQRVALDAQMRQDVDTDDGWMR